MTTRKFLITLLFSSLSVFLPTFIQAQSLNQDSPSPVMTDEISGKISARDIGDARLTTYFYTFFADNGDLNLRLETENFNGDVDIFTANGFRPLAKLTVFAGDASDVTTKTIYFRKREQVILRIEGRTPNDAAARFKISFSGSFAAAPDLPKPAENNVPEVAEAKIDAEKGGVRVNSVGTIIEVVPPKVKPTPEKTAPAKSVRAGVAEKKEPKVKETAVAKSAPKSAVPSAKKKTAAKIPPKIAKPPDDTAAETIKPAENDETATTAQPIAPDKPATENPPAEIPAKTAAESESKPPAETAPAENSGKIKPAIPAKKTAKSTAAKKPAKPKKAEPAAFDPNSLANIRLVVIMKDGKTIERAMNEIFRVTVDKGELTVITKEGKIEHYNLLEIQKFSIEP